MKKFSLILFALGAAMCAMAAGNGKSDKAVGYKYPLTQKFTGNPLFVTFPSQMYKSTEYGNMYTADPSARVWNIDGKEVLYVYCSHDMEPPAGCDRMDRYHVFSTEDLQTWTDHGEIFNAAEVNKKYSKEFPYAVGKDDVQFMWAPDCIYNAADKKYYYYFPKAVAWRGKNGAPETEWKIFVATSKEPGKGFKLAGYLNDAVSYIDPNVFLDDDGTLYFYQGGGAHVFGGKFKKDDWTKLDGTPEEMKFTNASDFHEGAWVFKKDGKYYLTYPDNHSPKAGGNRMRYATSNSPLGPWTEQGIYMLPHGEETAHGSVVQFKGKWYQFYHNGNYSGRGNLRSVCVAPLSFSKDGKINMIRNWGSPKGGKLPMISDAGQLTIEAEDYNDGGSYVGWFKRPDNKPFVYGDMKQRDMSVKTEGNTTYIADMTGKEWSHYSFYVPVSGTYTIVCHMRQHTGDSKFWLGLDGSFIGEKEIAVSSPKDQWGDTVIKDVEISAGEHYFEWRGAKGDIDIDRIVISNE